MGSTQVVTRRSLFGGLVLSSALWATPALAASSVRAAVEWQGECDDPEALAGEARARGAEVHFVEREQAAVTLHARVTASANEFVASVELESSGSRETREVAARECAELRRAIAWVLVVFAEEHAARESPSPEPEPVPAAPPAAAPEEKPQAAAVRASEPVVAAAPLDPCRGDRQRWHAGARLISGFGFVAAPALGPSAFWRYRPCNEWLAGLELSALYLTTLGYERDGRSLAVRRVAGRGAGWLRFGVPWLEVGGAVEAGLLSASASSTSAGPGGEDSASWLAFGLPVAAYVPLISRVLWAEASVEGLYAPSTYAFRYGSGETLADASHFEFRAGIGLGLQF